MFIFAYVELTISRNNETRRLCQCNCTVSSSESGVVHEMKHEATLVLSPT